MSGRSGAWIIRAGIAVSVLLGTGAGCDLNPPEPSGTPMRPEVIRTAAPPAPSPSPAVLAIWVLTPLGLNVHQQPSASSSVVGTAAQGAELNVDRTRQVAGQTWLQVEARDQSIAGWVLDEDDLVIRQAVDLHVDSDQSWSMLAPASWNVSGPGAPAGTTELSGGGVTMTVDVEAAAQAFTPPGPDVQDQQIELYGKTTQLSTYRLPDGSYELVSRARWDAAPPARYFEITCRDAGGRPDAALCRQLIDSIHVY